MALTGKASPLRFNLSSGYIRHNSADGNMVDNNPVCFSQSVSVDTDDHRLFRQHDKHFVLCRHDGCDRRRRERNIINRCDLSSQCLRHGCSYGNMADNNPGGIGKSVFMDTDNYHLLRQHHQHFL